MRLIFIFLFLMALPSVTLAQRGGKSHQLELNGHYGLVFSNPSSLNQLVSDGNTAATSRISEIKNLTSIGGEALIVFSPRFALGARYTTQQGTSGTGTLAAQPLELKIDVSDVTLVARYQFGRGRIATALGVSGGTTTNFKVQRTIGGVTSDFTASNITVVRGFLSPRINWGMLGIFIEGGYQLLKSSDVANASGVKLTSTRGTVEVDLSGPYAVGGLGFNF
jgi:hypothetical protein